MTQPLISLATAQLAREKGFNWETLHHFVGDREITIVLPVLPANHNADPLKKSRPTLAHLKQWLLETSDMYVYIISSGKNSFTYILERLHKDYAEILPVMEERKFISHPEALEAGLVQALLRS